MAADVVIWVAGVPVPQGSKTGYIVGKGDKARVVIADGSRRKRADGTNSRDAHKRWRADVAQAATDRAARNDGPFPYPGPVAVDITFWLPAPKSLARWRWLPWTKPDIDKLVRSVLDSITGSLIVGDSRVTDLTARKRYALGQVQPGCRIAVAKLPELAHPPDVYSQLGASQIPTPTTTGAPCTPAS